jgi:hypothetical protein
MKKLPLLTLVFPFFLLLANHAYADGTFTASNVHYDSATRTFDFDTDHDFSSNSPGITFHSFPVPSVQPLAPGNGGLFCSNTHCQATRIDVGEDQGVKAMVIDISYNPSNGTVNYYSQPLNYPELTTYLYPHIDTIPNTTIDEGTTYSTIGSFTDTDPDATSWTATVDYGDGTGAQQILVNSNQTFSLNHFYADNGSFTITVSITNNQGEIGIQTTSVTVNNIIPNIGPINAPSTPIQVNTSINASASFTDSGINDTHTATWNWGDGNSSTGTVRESNGSGTVSDTHIYTTPGVYTITLTITDKDGGASTTSYQYITVYDTSNKSVSGSKEFTSPVGAVTADPTATGKAHFGFTAKYDAAGNVIPIGNKWASLSFQQGTTNINFVATAYNWLVVNGTKFVLKGTGTLNNVSGYNVLISAIDGSQTGEPDLIRYQIKDTNSNVIYDTQPNANDANNPSTVVSKGKISIK